MTKKIRKIVYKIKCVLKYLKYKKECKKKRKHEFLIFNTPVHSNIGDHAIIYAEYEMLAKFNCKAFEIPTRYESYYFAFLKKFVPNDAIIAITGGGFIGSQWLTEENLVNKVISTFKNHKLIIFPQTIYFKNDEIGNKELKKSIEIFEQAKDLNIFAREQKTYDFARNTYKRAKVELVPDIVLSLNTKNFQNIRNGVLLCLRSDVEKNFSDKNKNELRGILNKVNIEITETDTVEKENISESERNVKIEQKLEEFSKSKLVITDRLHGMIFASITNTPCIVFGNYNYKVEGVYQWIKDIDKNIIFRKDLNNIDEDIERLLKCDLTKIRIEKDYDEKFRKLYQVLEDING